MAKGKYLEWLTAEGLELIGGWARDGLIDEDIAHNMGIAYSTFRTWKDKYPEIAAALKVSKTVADRRVESKLYKKAIGYEFEEKTFVTVPIGQDEYAMKVRLELDVWDEKNPDASGEERELFLMSIPRTKEVLEKRVVKMAHPDTTAIIFWLKNRKKEWSDKQIIEHSGQLDIKDQLAKLSDDDLRKLAESYAVEE